MNAVIYSKEIPFRIKIKQNLILIWMYCHHLRYKYNCKRCSLLLNTILNMFS